MSCPCENLCVGSGRFVGNHHGDALCERSHHYGDLVAGVYYGALNYHANYHYVHDVRHCIYDHRLPGVVLSADVQFYPCNIPQAGLDWRNQRSDVDYMQLLAL